jgi:hypothetical protein
VQNLQIVVVYFGANINKEILTIIYSVLDYFQYFLVRLEDFERFSELNAYFEVLFPKP